MTKVINIITGSGAGKTTTAAGIFYEMKKQGISCEYVQEWVKQWAWSGRKIVEEDQPTIFENQYKKEALLYGKVDYIITDSPYILSPIYEQFYFGTNHTKEPALNALKEDVANHQFFILNRTKPFKSEGRYETEEQAIKVDLAVKQFLCDNDIEFYEVTKLNQDAKVYEIVYEVMKNDGSGW